MKTNEIDKQAFQCKHVSKVADIPHETALERSGLVNNFFDQLFDISQAPSLSKTSVDRLSRQFPACCAVM